VAAKAPVKKAVPKKSKVKASKTKAKTKYTPAQQKAYSAASKKAIARARAVRKATVARARAKANIQGVLNRRALKVSRAKGTAKRITYYHQAAYGKAAVTRLHNQYLQAYFRKLRTTVFTQQQATSLSQAATAAANKAALGRKRKTPVKKTTVKKNTRKPSPFASAGASAGRAAAARIPSSRKLPVVKKRKAAKLTPVANAAWITAGNDEGVENCVAVAIANHLLLYTGYRLTPVQVQYLAYRDSVWSALVLIDFQNLWPGTGGLSEYGMVQPEDAEPGMVVGFETPQGSHCGVLMPDNKVISWGEIVPLESSIDEAWQVTWTRTSQ
jgi:hypothetical protein